MAYEGLGFATCGDGKQLIREKATYKKAGFPSCGRWSSLERSSHRSHRGSQIRTHRPSVRDEEPATCRSKILKSASTTISAE
jgi:hypothetical protein